MQNLPASYDEFKKRRFPVTTPLQLSVSTLPGVEIELEWGEFRSFQDVLFIIIIVIIFTACVTFFY